MIASAVVLASSPLIGPLAISTLAAELAARGFDVATPSAPVALDRYIAAVARPCRARPCVLVGFSAAGPRLFAVASVARPDAIVFMDARLPDDGAAPDDEPAFADVLDRLSLDADGLLPPWPSWWPDGVLDSLVPEPAQRAAFVAECPRVPRAMFSVPLPAPAFDGPCAYLAFGNTYADQRDLAARRGWPVATIDGARHLAPLVAPAHVADGLIALIGRL